MTTSSGTLLLQSFVATSMSNLDSSRIRNPSQETRKEGWTEEWGTAAVSATAASATADASAEDNTASAADTTSLSSPPSSTTTLTLTQFRPAWCEQLVLRLAGIDYTVCNSPYAATEATGPLPFIRHNHALVGHCHPGSSNTGNDILHYLQSNGNQSLLDREIDSSVLLKSKAHLVKTLIETQLTPALTVLRFQDDDAWEQIYWPQYVQAGSTTTTMQQQQHYSKLGAWFQAWSLRVVATNNQHNSNNWTVERAKQVAKDCYVTLEAMLQENDKVKDNDSNDTTTTTILGTLSLTTIDALLWGHLCDALCDVHIVTILASFPHLVQYVQTIHQEYFMSNTADNDLINAQNVFSQMLPLLPNTATKTYSHALELMQSLRPNLQQTLQMATETRRREKMNKPSAESSMIYTWRMGGTVVNKNKTEETTETTAATKKWREDHKSNDELWISCVVGITVLTMIFGTTASRDQ